MKKTARIAGLLYLVIVFCGFFYLRYVPTKLIVPDNLSATIGNIRNSETLFRLSILVEIISDLFFLLLSLTLYKLFKTVDKACSLLMVIFVAISIIISFIDLQNRLAVLTLLNKAANSKMFTPDDLKAQVLLYLDFYRNGILIGEIFWGLWLFPLGYLILKSGFLPKALGILLIAGCFGYLINSIGSFLFPHYNETIISGYITFPASIGELCLCVWLLIFGVKTKEAQ
jgi:hypothetical protein